MKLYSEAWDTMSEEAQDLDTEVSKFVEPIFEKFDKMGVSSREVAHVMLNAVTASEAEFVLLRNAKRSQIERANKGKGLGE